jgi:hypothetical protein
MFGFGKRNCRKDELFMSLSKIVDENTSPEQREKMMAGGNLIAMQIGLAFNLLRNGDATSQLSDEEFKFFMIIILQGINEGLYENIDISSEVKTNAFIFQISDGYKNFANIFNYYAEDVLRIFEKISSISSEEWVQKTFQEGKKIWGKLAENSGDMMPIADILENKDLVLNVKKVGLS